MLSKTIFLAKQKKYFFIFQDVWRKRKIIIDELVELDSDHGFKEDDFPETEIKSETFVSKLK